MSAITYVASHRIEPLDNGYLKIGTDISAAAGDNSFNSTSTSLSGLVNDEWIKVSGFSNAANNGWFQASAASTSSKISQDFSASIVTEAAGPTVTIKGYKRGSGQSYSFDLACRTLDRDYSPIREVNQPMDDVAPEVVFFRNETFENVVTDALTQLQVNQMREFFASTLAGEGFTFDKYGTVASPDNPLPAVLVSLGTEVRENTSFKYVLSFRIRVFETD